MIELRMTLKKKMVLRSEILDTYSSESRICGINELHTIDVQRMIQEYYSSTDKRVEGKKANLHLHNHLTINLLKMF